MTCPNCILYDLEPPEPLWTLEKVGGFLAGFVAAGIGVALAIRRWMRVP